jgi:hypothetical protein
MLLPKCGGTHVHVCMYVVALLANPFLLLLEAFLMPGLHCPSPADHPHSTKIDSKDPSSMPKKKTPFSVTYNVLGYDLMIVEAKRQTFKNYLCRKRQQKTG